MMIQSKKDLEEYIKKDLNYYFEKKDTKVKRMYSWIIKDNVQLVKQFVIQLRKCEYYLNNSYRTTRKKTNMIFDVKYLIAKRRLNKLQILLGIEIYENSFRAGLTIYHTGAIVVNPKASIGENCKLHGNNCIGNNGGTNSLSPEIGNNVQFGVGSKVIGNVKIADNIIIAAGAVVVDSFLEPGIVIAGVPARKIK